LLDGFKRYHALHDLGKESIRIHILPLGEHASKIAIINFNTTQRSISVLEESLIVTSLYREDKLNQVQIGVLLGKDKSWVCRRMALSERLSEEVVEHLRLGLICMSQARELSRLPRGNQSKALACVLKHRLCSHETQKLVTQFIKSPRWEHDLLLRLPLSILEQRTPPSEKISEDSYSRLYSSLDTIETIDSTSLINTISGKVDILHLLEQKIACTIQHLMSLQTNLKESTIHANSNHTKP
jgi:ParB-like chromosome segregation protein Spo0J